MNRFLVMAVAVALFAMRGTAGAAEVEIPKGWHYEACKQPEGEIVLWVEYRLEGLSETRKDDFYFRKSKRTMDDGTVYYHGMIAGGGMSWSSNRGLYADDKSPYSFSVFPTSPADKGIEVTIEADWTENGQKKKAEEKFFVPYQSPVAERRGPLSFKAHFERIEANKK